MTVGQRIALKRRELGLSQEALGERLGVSRQAIYKWESDAALPEIEKLVKLGREFSVSVGWLLGEEEVTPEKPELTPEQLRMVEEIVGRYLEAQPKPAPELAPDPEEEAEKAEEQAQKPKKPRRRRWSWVAFFCAAGAALLSYNLFGRLEQMNRDYQNLQSSIYDIQTNVNSQINGITRRVEEVLQSQNTLTAEQSAAVSSTDYRANTVTVTARAVPRTYVEGMTAEFILVSDGETIIVPGGLGPDHAFTADVTGPLSDDISVTVVFLSGDQRETQLIDRVTYLYTASFPEVYVNGGLWGSGSAVREYTTVDLHFYSYGDASAAPIDHIRVGLFRDRKLLAWYDHLDEQPGNFSGDWGDSQFFRLEGEWTMEPGYEYCVAAFVTDEYGRERVYCDTPVVYDAEKNFADTVNGWKEHHDPADWDY